MLRKTTKYISTGQTLLQTLFPHQPGAKEPLATQNCTLTAVFSRSRSLTVSLCIKNLTLLLYNLHRLIYRTLWLYNFQSKSISWVQAATK